MFNCVHINKIDIGRIRFDCYGNVASKDLSTYRSRAIKKDSLAVLGDKPSDEIRRRAYNYALKGEKLYFAKECHIPRDLYRNSGYSIVRDPDKADKIVIPQLQPTILYFLYDVAAYEPASKTIELFSVDRNESNRDNFSSDLTNDFFNIRCSFGTGYQFFQTNIENNKKATIYPFCQEYIDILENTYPGRKYIMEKDVNLDYPVTINLETLKLWKRHTDMDMLRKAICASDWREYPVTLCLFLMNEHPFIDIRANEALKFILEQIGFVKDPHYLWTTSPRMVYPKDWNLLQAYIMSELGVPETGGFVNPDTYNNTGYKDLYRSKYAVAPLTITEPILFKNLKTLLNL